MHANPNGCKERLTTQGELWAATDGGSSNVTSTDAYMPLMNPSEWADYEERPTGRSWVQIHIRPNFSTHDVFFGGTWGTWVK